MQAATLSATWAFSLDVMIAQALDHWSCRSPAPPQCAALRPDLACEQINSTSLALPTRKAGGWQDSARTVGLTPGARHLAVSVRNRTKSGG